MLEFNKFSSLQLSLKIDISIMLLYNLYLNEDMCNNTHLIVTCLYRDCIKECILDKA